MDFFYDGQIRRYLTQFMRAMSNFAYQDNSGNLTRIPVMYGDPNRQAASLLKKNTENTIPSAPFIACYIKGLDYEQSRLQDPTFVSKVHIRDRAVDSNGNLLNTQGSGYTVERIMPSPYKLTFAADIWTSSTEQKLQILEQLMVLFNPSLELQTTDNYIDWTSLTVLYLKSTTWTNRQVPQGTNQDIDIANLTFETPIWITPPAKVKKLGIITKIISNIFSDEPGSIATSYSDLDAIYSSLGDELSTVVVTPGNFELLVLDNTASLVTNQIVSGANDTSPPNNSANWYSLLDLYPGQFRAHLSQIRLTTPAGSEIVATISLDPNNDSKMLLNFNADTIPGNTIITSTVDSRGTIDAIINPETFNPANPRTGVRYLILEGINEVPEFGQPGYSGPVAWKNSDTTDFQAAANSIIQWDGSKWNVIFNSQTTTSVYYITNSYTGIQYVWENGEWSKSFEGIYGPEQWSLVL